MLNNNVSKEDAREILPNATTTKLIVTYSTLALFETFEKRICFKAQRQIREMYIEMRRLCQEVQPEIFKKAGAHCTAHGYCKENSRQCLQLKGKVPTIEMLLELWQNKK